MLAALTAFGTSAVLAARCFDVLVAIAFVVGCVLLRDASTAAKAPEPATACVCVVDAQARC